MSRFILLSLIALLSCSGNPNKSHNIANVISDPNHSKKEVVVFVYHRFGNSQYPSTNISLEHFEKHLSYLKANDFEVLNFGAAVDYINKPDLPYKENVVCITVDDGYKTFYQNALPLLKQYGFSATVFINSESVGGGTYMDWEELKQIHEQGIEIGNHSHSHAYFVNISENERIEQFKSDVQICQEEMEKHLGFTPDLFAYPYGEFDAGMKSVLKSMKFKAAAAQNSGVMHLYDDFAIPRFPMAGPYVKIEGFTEKANMKALRIIDKSSATSILSTQNPPSLSVQFDTTGVDLSRFNCFISNGCQSELSDHTITVRSEKSIKNRRTLYTITAPSKKGNKWHWFSHLWIRPEISE